MYIHLIGIGGKGMSGIAIILHKQGFKITGSDNNKNSEHLIDVIKLGIDVKIGHSSENVDKNCIGIVYSTAINNDNVEIIKGKKLNIPIYHRSIMLNKIIQNKKSVVISGQAGKTTTTSLITCLLKNSNLEPSFINGGIINEYNTQAELNKGDFFVVEADESDCSFININPYICVITNIYNPDLYEDTISPEKLENTFEQFIKKIPKDGLAILNGDDEKTNLIIKKNNNIRFITYGLNNNCVFRAINIKFNKDGTMFDVINNYTNNIINNVKTPMYGMHNVYNSLTLFSIAYELNISNENVIKTLTNYKGVKHRFTKINCNNKITLIDDLAQTPVKILSLIDSVKQFSNGKKFIINNTILFNRNIEECNKIFNEIDYIFLLNKTDNNKITTFEITDKNKHYTKNLKIFNIIEKDELVNLINKLIKPNDIIIYNMSNLNLEWNNFCIKELQYLINPIYKL